MHLASKRIAQNAIKEKKQLQCADEQAKSEACRKKVKKQKRRNTYKLKKISLHKC